MPWSPNTNTIESFSTIGSTDLSMVEEVKEDVGEEEEVEVGKEEEEEKVEEVEEVEQ